MNYKAVLFDMDGVICHTNPYHAKAFDVFFAKQNLFPTHDDYKAHMYGKSNFYIFSHFLNRKIDADELKNLEDEKESLFREIYKNEVVAINGFPIFLQQIKDAGVKVAVCTSAPKANLDLIIEKLGIANRIDVMLASEDVKAHKPNPEVYLKAAKLLQLNAQDCVVFEDSFSGATAGLNAGMKVVAVLSTHTQNELPICSNYINNYVGLGLDLGL